MKIQFDTQALFAAALLLAASMPLYADTLAYFPFTDNSAADTAGASNLTVTAMGTVSAAAITYNFTDVTTTSGAPAALSTGFDESTPTSYFTFTLTPDAGYQISIDNISFFSRSGTGTRDIELAAVKNSIEQSLLTDTIMPTYSFKSAPTSIASPGSVEIRLYGTDFVGSSFRIDDMLVQGLVRQTELITFFNFNDMVANNNGTAAVTKNNTIGTPTITLIEEGGVLADTDGQAGQSFIDTDGDSHLAVVAAGWTAGVNGPDPNTWTLNVDTTTFEDMTLEFQYRITNVSLTQIGPGEMTIAWAVGDGAFTDITTLTLTRDNGYHDVAIDLSAIGAIENIADVKLRGTWSIDGVTTGGGASARLDNLQLTGVSITAIPEPASALVMCGGAMVLLRRRRTR
jgi:hypothetical protein